MTWLIDFEGYSYRNAPPISIAMKTLNILQNHYPERLGLAVCYHPPRLFQLTWKVHPLSLPNSCLKRSDIMMHLVLPCELSCHHSILASCLCSVCSYGIRLQYALRPSNPCVCNACSGASRAVVMHLSKGQTITVAAC